MFMSVEIRQSKRLDRRTKDMMMLVVVSALGGLLIYQHLRLQKAVDLIWQLSGQVPGAS